MPRKFHPHNKDVLIAPERYENLDPQRVLSLLPLLAYQRVADVGCGPGYFTIPLAKYLFDGKVYALDIQQEMLDAVQREIENINLTNVELILTREDRLPLEDESLDGAFEAFVVHEAENATGLLEETKRCLRRGGWLALLEWHKRETEGGPPLEIRIDESELKEMAEEVGFRPQGRYSLNDSQYMLLMRK